MEDRFGYGAIVRAMRPEEREEMLGLLLEVCLVKSDFRFGTAVVILDQNGTGRKPHVQHRTAKDRNRGLHQIRS